MDQQPSVRVVYGSLTRKSKEKLVQLMQDWSNWHARHQSSFNECSMEVEHDDVTYFPALCISDETLVTNFTIFCNLDDHVRKMDQQPSVRVVYDSLTRKSKEKLVQLMQDWSNWHAQHQSSFNECSMKLEHGEVTYFPALCISSEETPTVSIWLDNQPREDDCKEYMNNYSIPLYDRECLLGSTTSSERVNFEALEAYRCHNCDSYNHYMKGCSRPRDNVAIKNSLKKKNLKIFGSRCNARYYEKPPKKINYLKVEALGDKLREALVIGEFDQPPRLHRMREMGYPPEYLGVEEDEYQPSGITIFGEEMKVECEDEELPEKGGPEPPEKKMTMEFPGINAPVTEDTDTRSWAIELSGSSDSNSFKTCSPPTGSPSLDLEYVMPYDPYSYSPDMQYQSLQDPSLDWEEYDMPYDPYSYSPDMQYQSLQGSSLDWEEYDMPYDPYSYSPDMQYQSLQGSSLDWE